MASAYLSRSISSTGNRKTWTYSAWIKKNDTGNGYLLSANDGSNYSTISFSGGALRYYDFYSSSVQAELKTNRLFRDASAWYHIVVRYDTTQSTADDRIRFYVNGVQETSIATRNNPSSTSWESYLNNSGDTNYINREGSGSTPMDCCMAHIHFTDGYSYAPTEFGETDATTGIWKPKKSPSVSYGTNGYFLKFDNSANMGLDSAGSNNFTTSGTIIQAKDTPTNVFATFNPLVKLTDATLTNANTTCAYGSASTRRPVVSTLAVTSGKYYYEAKVTASSSGTPFATVGIGNTMNVESYGNYLGATNGYSTHYQVWDGGVIVGNSNQETVTASVVNDIIGVAFDVDNYKIYFYKNGTLISSSSGIDFSGQTSGQGFWTPAIGDAAGSGTFTISYNFGNGYFGTTAVSSAQNPTDGVGIFEYTPPTNYRALCTKSINAQEYS